MILFRVFPYDPSALAGQPFAPDHVPRKQGSGRFDLRQGAVWYLAESPEHAVAEVLQGFRGRAFHAGMLRRFGHALSLCSVTLPDDVAASIVNLDDPAQLLQRGIAPSTLASEERVRTQAVSAQLYEEGCTGMRWWSRLSGDWHSVVVFMARVSPDRMIIGEPATLSPEHPAVRGACRALGISLGS